MNNKLISKVTIQNFKSIQELKDFSLNNINILIGANGAGKSNFTKFFTFIGAIVNNNLNEYVATKGGIDAFLTFGQKNSKFIGCKILLDGNEYSEYGFKLTPTLQGTFRVNTEETKLLRAKGEKIEKMSEIDRNKALTKHFKDLNELLRKVKVFHFNDTGDSSPIKKSVANNDNLFLRSDGENISTMIRRIYDENPDQYKLIVSTIKIVVPDFHDFVVIREDDYIQLEWYSKYNPDIPLPAHLLSDGSLRFICLAVLLLMPEELLPNTIIIDEPELGLHPYALIILADLIHRLSLKKQFIISTQSADFINYFKPEDIVVVDKNENGTTEFKRSSDEELKNWLEDYRLSDLWDMNIIGGRP